MKKIIFLSATLVLACLHSHAQLKIDANGNNIVKYGNFGPGSDGTLYLGDYNHYVKSKYGQGVFLGTYNWPDAVQIAESPRGVGINGKPYYSLDVFGKIRGYMYYLSDSQLKTNILPLANSLNLLSQLNPVSYTYNIPSLPGQSTNELNGSVHYGFIAQQLQNILPALVQVGGDGYSSIDYISLIALLVDGMTDQQQQINELESRVSMLESLTSSSMMSPDPGTGDPETAGPVSSNIANAHLYHDIGGSGQGDIRIKCFVPEKTTNAEIHFFNMQGTRVKKVVVDKRGESIVTLNGKDFPAGMYLYGLVVDKKLVDSKKLVLVD